jgi:hypothetical protein
LQQTKHRLDLGRKIRGVWGTQPKEYDQILLEGIDSTQTILGFKGGEVLKGRYGSPQTFPAESLGLLRPRLTDGVFTYQGMESHPVGLQPLDQAGVIEPLDRAAK